MLLEIVSDSPLVDKLVFVLHHPEWDAPVFNRIKKKIIMLEILPEQLLTSIVWPPYGCYMLLVVPVLLTAWHDLVLDNANKILSFVFCKIFHFVQLLSFLSVNYAFDMVLNKSIDNKFHFLKNVQQTTFKYISMALYMPSSLNLACSGINSAKPTNFSMLKFGSVAISAR